MRILCYVLGILASAAWATALVSGTVAYSAADDGLARGAFGLGVAAMVLSVAWLFTIRRTPRGPRIGRHHERRD